MMHLLRQLARAALNAFRNSAAPSLESEFDPEVVTLLVRVA
ncbi:hypothetical protein [Oscillatoria sp. FACHB-1406]|nr:hypothetical protein [Oscillatoria sp. FACHB-1406]